MGATLPFPHASNVQGADGLRELRPKSGASPWRPIYCQLADATFVILAIGVEAKKDKRRFDRAVSDAQKRLGEIVEGDDR